MSQLKNNWALSLILSLLMFSLPLGNQLSNIVLLVLLVFSYWLFKSQDFAAALKTPLVIGPAVFFLFHLLSLSWAENRDNGWVQLETKMSLLLVPLFLVAGMLRLSLDQRKQVMLSFVVGSAAAILFAFAFGFYRASQWVADENSLITADAFLRYTRLAEPIMHAGYFSLHLGAAMLILLFGSVLRNSWLKWSLIVLMLLGMWQLQGRMQILSLVVMSFFGALIFAWRTPKWRKSMLITAGVFIAVLVIVPKQYFGRLLELPKWEYNISGDESDFNSATYRLAEWKCALEAISRSPVIGTGVGDNRETLFSIYREMGFFQGIEQRFNAHNQFLETTIATGFLGLLILLIWWAQYTLAAVKKSSILSLSILSFFLLSLLTESMLERAWGVLFAAALVPVVLVYGLDLSKAQEDSTD